MSNDTKLTVPEAVGSGHSGLSISADLSYEEWERLGLTLKTIHAASLFWLGDWLR